MQRFALVGAGFIGSVHAANLAANPDVDLVLVHDVDEPRAAALAGQYAATATTDLSHAFDPGVVDAVLIASSTNTHADHLRRAADAGLAVLREKPIDLDLQRAVDAVGYATARSTRAMVDFNRRFDRDYAELKRVVESGEIGDVELIRLSTRGPSMPPLDYIAVSGGQMRDQTVHFFDLARWLSGLDPVEVYGYDERIEILGSTGLVEARGQRTGSVARFHADTMVGDGLHAGWFERARPTYAAALAHFVSALERDHPISPTLTDGLKAQAIAETAKLSLTTGRTEPIAYP